MPCEIDYMEGFSQSTLYFSKEKYVSFLAELKQYRGDIKETLDKESISLHVESKKSKISILFMNSSDVDLAISSLNDVITNYDAIRKDARDSLDKILAKNHFVYKLKVGVKDFFKEYIDAA